MIQPWILKIYPRILPSRKGYLRYPNRLEQALMFPDEFFIVAESVDHLHKILRRFNAKMWYTIEKTIIERSRGNTDGEKTRFIKEIKRKRAKQK